MKKLLTLTYIVFSLLLGLIIGGLIFGNKTAWILGLIFLAVDVVLGITLQYLSEKKEKDDYRNRNDFD